MKVLFIGGTGTISTEITKLMAERGNDVYLLNRGSKNHTVPENVKILKADIYNEEESKKVIGDNSFDVVADFIAFHKSALERDYRLFNGKTRQFIFISSASAYQKPPVSFPITESTPLANPYWEYSRNKIECEEYLVKKYREDGFPITIVRPSHTYNDYSTVIGGFEVLSRMLRGKKVIIPGDGATLWTLTNSRDFAKAFAGLCGNVHAIGDAFHITGDEVLTWNQIYQIYADALSVKLNAVHISTDFLCDCATEDLRGSLTGDKSNNAVFDNSKIKKLVPDFCATTRFDQGVLPCVKYFMENKKLQDGDEKYDRWCDAVIAAQEAALLSVIKWREEQAGR
ncbi:MAG: SDR family oxidoreductase [Clostridiales bacterium]|jgi:nucleoside-diphosphate-sugar epimerase|nr:SDR family oxidoreductase [Clostridiales bacterium]